MDACPFVKMQPPGKANFYSISVKALKEHQAEVKHAFPVGIYAKKRNMQNKNHPGDEQSVNSNFMKITLRRTR